MKKKFLSAILFGALLVSSTGTFVSCKDYDDDISSLQAKDSELSTQLSTQLSALQSALDAANADIAAAKAEAAAAKAEAVAAAKDLADEAKAEAAAAKAEAAAAKADAAAAKEAAATAKAEAIEAAKAQVEEMLKDVATAAQVKELEARVAAIEGLGLSAEQLGKLSEQLAAIEGLNLPAELEKLNELVKTVNELGTQLAAVEKYQELIKANADALDVFKKEVEGKYATSASVAEEIKKAIQGLASEEYVSKEISDKITAALQGNGAIGQAISSALTGYATQEYVQQYVSEQTAAAIEALDLDGQLDNITNLVNELHSNLVTLLGQELRSLVFWPDLYVGGMEATEYEALRYVPLTNVTPGANTFVDELGTTCAITSPTTQWSWAQVPSTLERVFAPEATVKYHMNPSSAKIKSLNHLSFESRDVKYVTRAENASRLGMTITGKNVEAGVLEVNYNLNDQAILLRDYDNADDKDRNGTTEASIFALSVKVRNTNGLDNDTTITSDYAMMYVTENQAMNIAYRNDANLANPAEPCTIGGRGDHLWPTVGQAIQSAPTLRVKWDGQIDLKEYLVTHYNHTAEPVGGVANLNNIHKVWEYGQEEYFGLHYDYALIDYAAGRNQTSDSRYVQLANGIIRPTNVNAQGETVDDPNVASVGRRPLVRVRLLDSEDNTVLVGFIKLEIVREVENLETQEFQWDDVKFGCNPQTVELKWSQVSAQVLTILGMTKGDFDLLYSFDQTAGVGNQWVKTSDRKYEAATAAQIYGQVQELPDPEETTTNVLRWTLTMSDMQRIYQESPNHSKTIYVRYTSQNDGQHAPVYLPLKVTVTKPQGTVGAKINEYWYNGYIRLNVAYPQDGGNTRNNFVVDLDQAWVTNKPVFNPTAGYASYTNAIFANEGTANGGYKYYFDEENDDLELPGTNYHLFVNNNNVSDIFGNVHSHDFNNTLEYALQTNRGVYTNTTLYAGTSRANRQAIATINQTTGEITYINNATSRYLLNLYAHDNAQLIAHIGVVPYTPCGIAMAASNDVFTAQILRPIDVEKKAVNDGFRDAEAGGSWLYIADLLDFNDWRGEKFVDGNNYSNSWLFAYYNVSGVKILRNDITTDMNGGTLGTTKLNQVTSQVEIWQYKDDEVTRVPNGENFDVTAYNSKAQGTQATYNAVRRAMGKIKYENNGNNVKDFNVRIPIEITYDWGTLKTYVDCHVEGTMGN